MKLRLLIVSIGLTLTLFSSVHAQQPAPAPIAQTDVRFDSYYRTELYMGMSIPGGGTVRGDDWEKFLSEIVTPLFPDGFTVLDGRGQYREASGKIAKEPSHVLVFLYKKTDRKAASVKIESIRNQYKKTFAQESVLRVDLGKSVRVSF